jgi:hypothetical protein
VGTKAHIVDTRHLSGLWFYAEWRSDMRFILSLLTIPMASAANAHVGHIGDLAGHDHWVAAGAIGLAGLVAVWGALKGKKDAPRAEPEPPATEEEAAT